MLPFVLRHSRLLSFLFRFWGWSCKLLPAAGLGWHCASLSYLLPHCNHCIFIFVWTCKIKIILDFSCNFKREKVLFFLNTAVTLCVNDKLQLAEQHCLVHESRSSESLQSLGFCECEFWILVLHTAFEWIYLKFSQRMLQMLKSYLQLSKLMKGNLVRGPCRGWLLKPLTCMCVELEPGSERQHLVSALLFWCCFLCLPVPYCLLFPSLKGAGGWGWGRDCRRGTGWCGTCWCGSSYCCWGERLESKRSSVFLDCLLGNSRTGCPA